MTSKKQILIVEDDREMQVLLGKRLRASGFSCISTPTVEGALKVLKEVRPNLVILDLGLPGANGTAFLQGAKDWLPPGSQIPPVIVLSGHKDKEVVDYAMDEGAKGFLAKPVDSDLLLRMVNEFISST